MSDVDGRVLVLMPTVKDGERTLQALAADGQECAVCADMETLCAELRRGAGAALLTEEALARDDAGGLAKWLKAQPPWSDLPLVVVVGRDGSFDGRLREAMNATLVERPIKIRSLRSVVRAALRARRRQYEVRNHLAERKTAEDRLRESEQRFRLMADAVPVLIWLSDASKRCTWFNKSWLDFAGRTLGELVGDGWAEGVHPDDRERRQAVYAENFDARRPFQIEYRLLRRDGVYRWVVDNGVPRFDGEDEFAGYIGSCVDFTDRKDAEEGLRRFASDLAEADRKKDDFIALLAHELRNPLAPIRNGLQVLRRTDDPEMRNRSQEVMDRQLMHMVRLIDDLLDVSRIGRNKMELRLERVSLQEVISSAVETAQPALDALGHALTVTLPGKPVELDADLTRLAQVFLNLLTNSAKYTPRGGNIRLSAELHGETVVVSVRDTGIGIPEASLPSIFDMFSQVDRSIERTTGGLGIGLALVKGLTEMHGGTVSAASDAGGSTFTVTLPVPPPRTAAWPNEAPAPTAPPAARRVLVVDDNRDGAESLSQLLKVLGHEVRTAFDGVEAVEAARSLRPELVLMDVGMPRLNGYEATRRIREESWGVDMTIIALTGWGQDGDRALSRAAGCNGHLVKPVSLADLQKALDDA